MGGLIIMNIGYKGLFWVDGVTCIIAILIFWLFIKEKKHSKFQDKEHPGEILTHSVFKDKIFWTFLLSCTLSGILFFQLFTTFPLYQKEQFNLTEFQTGLLLMMNGIIIFLLEMPIVSYIERNKINKIKVITIGSLGMAVSMFLLLINFWSGILIIMMLFMTFGEMFCFPFSNSFAMSRAPKGHEGRYMAIFTMCYSASHILSGKLGLETVAYFKNYQANWLLMGSLGLIATFLGLIVMKMLKEK
jgi:predicted MFS family arabinose efflux permease